LEPASSESGRACAAKWKDGFRYERHRSIVGHAVGVFNRQRETDAALDDFHWRMYFCSGTPVAVSSDPPDG
jgi:hypothetical protein